LPRWALPVLAALFLVSGACALVSGPDALRHWVGDGPILTDDRPRLEYFLSLPKDEPPADLRTLKGDIREILRP